MQAVLILTALFFALSFATAVCIIHNNVRMTRQESFSRPQRPEENIIEK